MPVKKKNSIELPELNFKNIKIIRKYEKISIIYFNNVSGTVECFIPYSQICEKLKIAIEEHQYSAVDLYTVE